VSLVSEALKKAQNEAAQREAREKGLPAPLLSAHPYRAPRGGPRAAVWGLAAATVLLLATAGYLWLSSTRKDERHPMKGENGTAAAPETASAPASAAPAQPAQATAGTAPAERPPESPAAASSSAPPPEPASPTAGAAETNPSTSSPEASGSPAEAVTSPGPRAKAPSSAPQARPGGEERTFVRVAELGDGAKIHLGGIAWSQTAPLAYVNGRLVGVGEAVAGLTVERIERDRVVLAGDRGRIVLTLR
jgi:hypothetical protein